MLFNQKKNNTSILPVFVVATFVLNVLTILLLMYHQSMLKRLSGQLPQSLVQLVDGRAITIDSQENLERNPETIRRFVGETMTMMFTWSDKQPQQIVWQATSELLSGDVRRKFEVETTQGIPKGVLANPGGNAESLLLIRRISQPEKIADGQWQVEIVANRLIFAGYNNKMGEAIPFNKKILIRALETQAISIPNVENPLYSAIYRLNEARLEIANICDIKQKKCP
ncbi:hypothetical protein [Brasilonema bromeliae]|uniref:Uncharacterized protein n=1 Tax=Brasilonema bromeliae SPC951 TaxID=385972 RepID=A0ABX1PAY9_9CYAN|nr:hypothetical protein [Brasilonema bromeliae]NMG21143.1 hypothetical protein [Brasilonema bromeliae SPC951]